MAQPEESRKLPANIKHCVVHAMHQRKISQLSQYPDLVEVVNVGGCEDRSQVCYGSEGEVARFEELLDVTYAV